MNLKETLVRNKETTIKIIVSLLILLFLFKFINFQLLLNSIKNINSLFLLTLIILPFSILLRAWRWMIILNKDVKIISIKDSYILTLVGIALNIFLPASMGDVAKSYYGYKWHGTKEEMLSSSIVDKFMALLSVFVIGTLAALFMQLYILSFLSAVLGLMFLLIIFFPKSMPWKSLNRIFKIFLKTEMNEKKLISSFAISNKVKFITLCISIFAWLVSYFMFLVVCLSFNVNVSFTYILAIAPLINLAVIFPFTVNGLGSGEAVITYLFGLVSISPTLAVVISLMYSQILTTIIPGLFGLFIIIKK